MRGGLFSGKGTRTPDLADMSRLLYQLSYAAKQRAYYSQTSLAPSRGFEDDLPLW